MQGLVEGRSGGRETHRRCTPRRPWSTECKAQLLNVTSLFIAFANSGKMHGYPLSNGHTRVIVTTLTLHINTSRNCKVGSLIRLSSVGINIYLLAYLIQVM